MSEPDHGTSYRGDEPWQQRALCKDDPGGWDLDIIGTDPQLVRDAVRACRKACPVFADCRSLVKTKLIGKMRPQDQVIAGLIFRNKRAKKDMPPCLHGHDRTPDNTTNVGACKECRRIRNREYQARLRADARATRQEKGAA